MLNVGEKKKENVYASVNPSKWKEWDLLIKLYHPENPVLNLSW